jgi:hypothetical protein
MIIVYNYKDKKPFTIIGKKKSGGGGGDVEPKPLLKSKIYIGNDGSSNDDIVITIPKEVGSFYGSVGNDYENSTFYPNEEGTVLTTNSSAGFSLFNISKTDKSSKHISFNRKVQVEIDLFEDIDDYSFNRLFYTSSNVSKVVITSYNVKIGKSAFENTFYYAANLAEVIFDLKNSELSEGTFIGTFEGCTRIGRVNIGRVKINENCKSTFKETFKDAGNGGYFNGEFDISLNYTIPEHCFEFCFATPNNYWGGLYFLGDVIHNGVEHISKRGMYGMFYNNRNMNETPRIMNLHTVEDEGMGYCFSNNSNLNRISIDFRNLQNVGIRAFEYMFSGSDNTELHFEIYDDDDSNILMNIGNNSTVFSEYSCYSMFDNTYINSPNLLNVEEYYNPIPEGCFERMFESSKGLVSISIGSMRIDDYNTQHPFQNTFSMSENLIKINSNIYDYGSFESSDWLSNITTNGVLQVKWNAYLGSYENWLPNNWTIEN